MVEIAIRTLKGVLRRWDSRAMPRGAAIALAAAVVAVGAGCGSHRAAQLGRGDLDPSFGEDGLVLRDFFGFDDWAATVATGRGGTVLVAGRAERDPYGRKSDQVVLRYRDDGSLDPGFGRDGVVRSPLGDLADIVELHDGKLVLVGSAKRSAAVVRLLPD